MYKLKLLAVLLGLSVAPMTASAQSHASVSFNGKTIVVMGARSQSVSTSNDTATISADGVRIELDGETLTMDGQMAKLGDYQTLEVMIADGKATITADGRAVFEH